MTLKIATFNVNSVRARLPIVEGWLAANEPDALCLQETKVKDADFPLAVLESAGYRPIFRGESSYNGVALLARDGVDARLGHFGFHDGGPPDESRLMAAEVAGIPILNTYVPQGRSPQDPMFQYKIEWFARLKEYFQDTFSPQEPLLWVGDMNVAPQPIDVHDPVRLRHHVGFHPREREAFAKTVAWGFVDVLRKHHPQEGQFTFWDYRVRDSVARGKGWRIDHILATKPLADRSTRAWIDIEPRLAARPSDHTVLVAEFAVSG